MKQLFPNIAGKARSLVQIANRLDDPRRSTILNAKSSIFSRYREYVRRRKDLISISTSVMIDPEKEAMLHCYTGNNKELKKVKSKIIEAQPEDYGDLCQYCGQNRATTFDHYLPKEDFPEFSLFSWNLIPCCPACNQKKGKTWHNGAHRTIINFYFDNITSDRYLYATITPHKGTHIATFFFDFSTTIPNSQQQLIRSHFYSLGLFKKYSRSSGRIIVKARNAFRNHLRGFGNNDVLKAQKLLEISQAEREQYGENYWEAAIYEALSLMPHIV